MIQNKIIKQKIKNYDCFMIWKKYCNKYILELYFYTYDSFLYFDRNINFIDIMI